MSYISKFVFCAAVLLPVGGFCGDAVMATASGEVRLNGKPLLKSSVVFAGDGLETVVDSAVVLHGRRFSVQIGPMASSVLENGALLLKLGDLQAKGLVTVRAGVVTAFGDSAGTRFALSHSLGMVRVKVMAGTVVVRRDRERVVLSPGESRSFEDENSPPAVKRSNRRKILLAVGGVSAAGIGSVVATHLKDHDPIGFSPSYPESSHSPGASHAF